MAPILLLFWATSIFLVLDAHNVARRSTATKGVLDADGTAWFETSDGGTAIARPELLSFMDWVAEPGTAVNVLVDAGNPGSAPRIDAWYGLWWTPLGFGGLTFGVTTMFVAFSISAACLERTRRKSLTVALRQTSGLAIAPVKAQVVGVEPAEGDRPEDRLYRHLVVDIRHPRLHWTKTLRTTRTLGDVTDVTGGHVLVFVTDDPGGAAILDEASLDDARPLWRIVREAFAFRPVKRRMTA